VIERVPTWVLDVGVTVVVALIAAGDVLNGEHHPLVAVVAIGGAATLLLRRRRPLLVLALVSAAAFALTLAGTQPLVLGLLVAFFGVASNASRRTSLYAAAAAFALVAVGVVLDGSDGPASSLPMLLALAVAWLFGNNTRERNRRNEERAREAVAEERARIARELHDVVTHTVSVMVVQAAAANEVFADEPERAREALGAIEETGRRALGELRRLLGVVADGEGDGTLPQPGLASLDELVERVRGAGIDVAVTVEGTPHELPPGVELSAFRVVQEALTNTLKHAGASRVGVVVRYGNDALELEVRDDGVGGVAAAADGRGLVGMRERAALFGGEVHAGSAPGGGFTVRARLPLAST
jgi:signal transduction histidine kinase